MTLPEDLLPINVMLLHLPVWYSCNSWAGHTHYTSQRLGRSSHHGRQNQRPGMDHWMESKMRQRMWKRMFLNLRCSSKVAKTPGKGFSLYMILLWFYALSNVANSPKAWTKLNAPWASSFTVSSKSISPLQGQGPYFPLPLELSGRNHLKVLTGNEKVLQWEASQKVSLLD